MAKNIVVIGALILTSLFVLSGVLIPEKLGQISEYLLFTFISENFGWYYMLAALTFVVVCLFTALSKYGNIRLGKDDDKPEFNFFTWVAMLYSAGLAISLFFWGVAEPVFIYMDPPFGDGGTKESAELAMRWTFSTGDSTAGVLMQLLV